MKSKKKNSKKKVFSKKGGYNQIMNNTNLVKKRLLCHSVNGKYSAINPMRSIACENLELEGEKICKIEFSRYDPHFGSIEHHLPMPTCVVKKPQQIKHSKSTEKMYKKGELNRSTNIGAIINERERIKTLKKKEENRKAKIAKEINEDNFSSVRTPKGIYPALNKKKEENRKVKIAKEINEDNFSSVRTPNKNNKWKYLRNKKKVKNKVEKRKAATNYEVAEL